MGCVMQNESNATQADPVLTSDVLKRSRFRDRVIANLGDLNSEDPNHQSLERGVRLMLELVEESKTGRYGDLPIDLFARALIELDQFLLAHDEDGEARAQAYMDVLDRISSICEVYRDVLDVYQEWSDRQPEFDKRRITQKITLPTDTYYP